MNPVRQRLRQLLQAVNVQEAERQIARIVDDAGRVDQEAFGVDQRRNVQFAQRDGRTLIGDGAGYRGRQLGQDEGADRSASHSVGAGGQKNLQGRAAGAALLFISVWRT